MPNPRLTFGLAADAVTDIWGNPGTAYSGSFTTDIATAAFPTPLTSVAPSGSLIYDGSLDAVINPGSDTDSLTINLDAGQTLTVVAVPATTLQPTLTVTDPGGVGVGSVTASTAGKQAVMQTIPMTAAGTYTITVSSAGGTTGQYTLQLTLNAAVEEEEHSGASNNTFATAQPLDAAFLSLGGSSQRAAVLGATSYPQPFLTWNMNSNPGWTISGGQWAFGHPTGGGGTYG